MASGNRSGFGWDLDKRGVDLDYCDVGLGLKIPWQQQQQLQQQRHQQQHQQQQHSSVSWLTENSRIPSPTVPGFPQPSRFGEGGRVTFTAGQRQELERQTIIYKFMMASMPVPPELLIPLSKSPSSMGRKAGVELRYSTSRGGGDPEPWRCRRTDGKKWRCSRDVAPDQKYCERHSHKGRPSRSRKPVESPSPSSLAVTSTTAATTVSSFKNNPILFSPYSIPKPSSQSFDLPSPPQFSPFTRYPDWFMKKEVAPTASACLYPQQIGGGETTRTHAVPDHNQSCMHSRPFIDAWSLGDHVDPKDATNNPIDSSNKRPNPSSPLTSILPLTLSMSAGIDHDHHHNSEDHNKDHPEVRLSSSSQLQPLNWTSSWIGSPPAPGGPLAEALCLGISGAGSGMIGSHSDELVLPHGHSTSSSTTSTLG